jgi:ribose transport system permease protein
MTVATRERPAATTGGSHHPDRSSRAVWILREYGIVVTCVAVFLVLSVTQSAFFSVDNLRNVVYQNAPLAILAIGTTIAIIMGGFDLSLGSVYAFAGITAAWFAVHVDPTLALFAGVAVGLIVGTINGLLITGLRINSFLATLATGMIVIAVGQLYSSGFLISVEDLDFQTLGSGKLIGLEDATWVLIVFGVVVGVLLARSRFGRYAYAVGGNADAARLSGVRLSRMRIAAFAISGLGAGLAGVIAASRVGQGSTDVGQDLTLQAIAAVVVGGTSILGGSGAIWRTAFGVALLAMIANGFNLFGVDPIYGDVMTGFIIIVAVALQGLGRRRA